MLRGWVWGCGLLLIQNEMGVAQAAERPEVRELVVETVKMGTFFRVRLAWPSERVSPDFATFLRAEDRLLGSGEFAWPIEALGLVSQDGKADRVVPVFENSDLGYDGLVRLPSEVVFLGRLRGAGSAAFVLRHPTPQGDFARTPLTIDFSKARPGKDLAKAFSQAWAEFFKNYRAPKDVSFFGYAREILESRQGKKPDPSRWRPGMARPGLYEVTTGALALQENLQLDRMRNPNPDTGQRSLPLGDLTGITVPAHDYDKMLGGKTPAVEEIAKWVPQEQYYLRFHSLKTFRRFLDEYEAWGGLALQVVDMAGRDFGLRSRLEAQLCLRPTLLSELLGDTILESVVFTGSDPYLVEGSDLSVLFRVKTEVPLAETALGAALNRLWKEAEEKYPGLKKSEEKIEGVTVEGRSLADRSVSSFRARVKDGLVVSNSRAALKRILSTIQGSRPALAQAKDFLYLRSIYPVDSPEEDGFLFLSDPFLRELAGPRLRIAEKRRLETLTTLEMVHNAALLHLFENPAGKTPDLNALFQFGLLDRKRAWVEPGDRLAFDPANLTASSERYGRPGFMLPAIEVPVERVTPQEKTEYETFRNNYQSYWKNAFDPIGLRVSLRERTDLSLTVLPLIAGTEYAQLRETVGGQPVELEPVPRPQAWLHLALHLDPKSRAVLEAQTMAKSLIPGLQGVAVEWLGERLEFWVEDHPALARLTRERLPSLLSTPIVLAVEVKNSLGLAAFLVALRGWVQTAAPGMVVFEPVDPYRGAAFTRIRPSAGMIQQSGELKDFAVYYGSLANHLVVSNSFEAVKHAVDAAQPEASPSKKTFERWGAARQAHFAGRLGLEGVTHVRALLEKLLLLMACEAERDHLRALWLVGQTLGGGLLSDERIQQVLGYRIESSLGNRYSIPATPDLPLGSATGDLLELFRKNEVPFSPAMKALFDKTKSLRGTLEFREDGLQSDLSLR